MNDETVYVDACAEWDDPEAFRVYLLQDGDAEPVALKKIHSGTTTMARLYRAAFAANARDFVGIPAQGRDLGWSKEAPAKRAAKACRAEWTGSQEPTIDLVRALAERGEVALVNGGLELTDRRVTLATVEVKP